MITTPQLVEEAELLLLSVGDGSTTNRQARAKAIEVLKAHYKKLSEFLMLNPDCSERLKDALIFQCDELEKIIETRSYPLSGMNDYERFQAYGWERYYIAKRFDYFKKIDSRGNKWVAVVPHTVDFDIFFERNGVKQKSNKQRVLR